MGTCSWDASRSCGPIHLCIMCPDTDCADAIIIARNEVMTKPKRFCEYSERSRDRATRTPCTIGRGYGALCWLAVLPDPAGAVRTDVDVRVMIRGARCDRDRVLLEVLYCAGLRISEALELKWSAVI